MFEKEARDYQINTFAKGDYPKGLYQSFKDGAEFGYNKCKEELNQKGLALQSDMDKTIEQNIALKKELNKANEWHKLDWKKDFPDVDKLVRVRTKSGEEYICQTYLYYPTEDEIGYGSAITQFEELNGDWVDDNEIGYWCYIEPFKESE